MERSGYSRKIEDPAFNKYLKQTSQWSGIFSIGLAIIAFIGFTIAGELKLDGVENPQGMMIGAGIGGMFLLIGFFSILSRKRSKTWDGVIVDKTIKHKKRRDSDDHIVKVDIYLIKIRETSGKIHEIRTENDATVYNYYKVGDHVRHHAGLNAYEKYDKTGDHIIFCAACATLNDIDHERCTRCSCPLLK